MDLKNYEYLRTKIDRYEKLHQLKDKLNNVQSLLVKDCEINLVLDNDGMNRASLNEKLPAGIQIDEHDELMREIKDNLIDSIGMKIVEIEEKMKDL